MQLKCAIEILSYLPVCIVRLGRALLLDAVGNKYSPRTIRSPATIEFNDFNGTYVHN